MTKTKNSKKTLGWDGLIFDQSGKKIGVYKYSLYHNTYSWVINNGTIHHFWQEQELMEYLEANHLKATH